MHLRDVVSEFPHRTNLRNPVMLDFLHATSTVHVENKICISFALRHNGLTEKLSDGRHHKTNLEVLA